MVITLNGRASPRTTARRTASRDPKAGAANGVGCALASARRVRL